MNPEIPRTPREELEARLTTLLLGELTPEEAEATRRAIAQDAYLTKLHAQLQATIALVREAAASEVEPATAQPSLKLTEERRAKLLAQFKTTPPLAKAEAPAKPARDLQAFFGKGGAFWKARNMPWLVPVATAAIVLLLAVIATPNFVRARNTAAKNSILNNLRVLDAAKQQWALENKKSDTDVPTLKDIAPYFKGDSAASLTVAGEKYELGRVQDDPVAIAKNGEEVRLPSADSGALYTASDNREKAKLGLAFKTWGSENSERYPTAAPSSPPQPTPLPVIAAPAPAASANFARTSSSSTRARRASPITPLPSAAKSEPVEVAGAAEPEASQTVSGSVRGLHEGDDIRAKGTTELAAKGSQTIVLPSDCKPTAGFDTFDKSSFGISDYSGQRQVEATVSAGSLATPTERSYAGRPIASDNWYASPGSPAAAAPADSAGARALLKPSNQAEKKLSETADQSLTSGLRAAPELMGVLERATPQAVSENKFVSRYAVSSPASAADRKGGEVQAKIALEGITAQGGTAPLTTATAPKEENYAAYAVPVPTDQLAGGMQAGVLEVNGDASPVLGDVPATGKRFNRITAGAGGAAPGVAPATPAPPAASPTVNFGLVTATNALAFGSAGNFTYQLHAGLPAPTMSADSSVDFYANDGAVKDSPATGVPAKHYFADNSDRVSNGRRLAEQPNVYSLNVVGYANAGAAVTWDEESHAKRGDLTLGGADQANVTKLRDLVRQKEGVSLGNGIVEVEKASAVRSPAVVPPPMSPPPSDTGVASTTRGDQPVSGPVRPSRVLRASGATEPESRKVAELALADGRQPFYEAKQKLEEAVRLRCVLNMKLASEKIDVTLPKTTVVEIVDRATPAQKRTGTFGGLLAGGYSSAARIRVERDASDIRGLSDSPYLQGYDPYFVQTEYEMIQSEPILSNVVNNLGLDESWGKERGGGNLTKQQAVALLKEKLDLKPAKGTSLIAIRAKSDKPEEAAKIANAVAEAYQEYRREQRRQLTLNAVKVLEDRFEEQEQKVREAQKKVDELSRQPASSKVNPVVEKPATPPVEVDTPPVRRASTNAPIPQPEVQTSDNSFSTFSLNVSDVAFKLAAASLEKGQMPDAAPVRAEEFINAFDYRDPEAQAGVPIAFAWERARYPFAHNRDLLRFSLKTGAAGRQAGRPLNLVLLLDNSGSMERADRVQIIREALRVLAGQLQPQDKLSLITFARTPRLWVDGVAGDKAGEVLDQVSGLTPQGGTNLEEAMNLAYATALRHYLASGINRVVLLTDGAANLGNVEPEALKQKVEAHRKQGIAFDCFGIGWEGFNDDLLEVLSRNGDGRYGFINTPDEAATEFAGQLAGALKVAASDVKVQVEFNPKRVTAYRQIGYAKHQLTKEQFRDNTVDAAEIAAQEAGNALYTVEVNPAGAGPLCTVRCRFKIPGTTDYREHEWAVPYTGNAVSLEQASPAMRLAASASAFAEWLVVSPFAGEVTPDRLLGCLSGVPETFGADTRPKKLEWMIRQAKSIAGK